MSSTLLVTTIKKTNTIVFALCIFISLTSFRSGTASVASEEDKMEEICQLREFVAGYAQNFTGAKYCRAGTSPRSGFDCSGFTSYILKEFDVKVSQCSATQSKEGMKIPLEAAQTGDLLFFGRRGYIQHVALIVDKTSEGFVCVHSTSSRGVVVENITQSDYWRSRVLFARDVIVPAVLSR